MISKLISIYHQLSLPQYDKLFLCLLLLIESILCILIINIIPYTEIDWEAYMEEVSTFQSGELNYVNIKGGTGPLVYPAGFLYVYGILKWASGGGKDIFKVQCIFCVLYVCNMVVVLNVYSIIVDWQRKKIEYEKSSREDYNEKEKHHDKKSSSSMKIANTVWSWRISMVLLCLSKRIHSIYILRLFNDAPCMLLFYISVYLFLTSKFKIGCIFFSLAVSIKMNILLFAPGLLLLLLQYHESWIGTVQCLCICAIVQGLLGAPFLVTYPVSYIRKAFEFDRVFFFKWTVNWKFLQEDIFISKPLSVLLLISHIATLIFFAKKWIKETNKQNGKKTLSFSSSLSTTATTTTTTPTSTKSLFLGPNLTQPYIVYTLFVSNFIGIAFARTLHYQFYSWYFHSLPLLLWMTDLPILTKVAIMSLIEYAFNIFPATPMSSASLQFAHFVLLISLWKADVPPITNTILQERKKNKSD